MRGRTPARRRRLATPVLGAVAAAAALVGCSSESTPTPAVTSSRSAPTPSTTTSVTASSATSGTSSTSSTSSTSATSTAVGRTIAITVTGSTVTPAPAQVDLPVGQTLTLVVTSDHADELHAHGFEVEADIVAGQPATVALTGKEPGVFEVELHEPALTLLTVAVR